MRAEINVLGTLEVWIDGVSIVPTASKSRQLLALLAINAGSVVTSSMLIEELWGTGTPRSALGVLQTYVLHVRRLIRNALPGQEFRSRDILATKHTGYVMQVDPGAVDAVRYDRLAASGRAAGAAGDYERAGELLSAALALWRGPVLVDVAAGSQLELEAMRLVESRLNDLTLRIDADLYLGRHHQLLADLAVLCARHPYRENFRAQHMLALYRSGRLAQALGVYHETCVTIRDQLGVGPSARLRELHRAIVAGDSVVDDPAYMVNTWTPDAIAG